MTKVYLGCLMIGVTEKSLTALNIFNYCKLPPNSKYSYIWQVKQSFQCSIITETSLFWHVQSLASHDSCFQDWFNEVPVDVAWKPNSTLTIPIIKENRDRCTQTAIAPCTRLANPQLGRRGGQETWGRQRERGREKMQWWNGESDGRRRASGERGGWWRMQLWGWEGWRWKDWELWMERVLHGDTSGDKRLIAVAPPHLSSISPSCQHTTYWSQTDKC